MKGVVTLLCLFLGGLLVAQPGEKAENLKEYEAFFNTQADQFQKWLEGSDLGKLVRVHSIDVHAEGVALNLQTIPAAPNTCPPFWMVAEEEFVGTDELLNLEERLFLKMLQLFDLASGQALLQVRDRYKSIDPGFYLKVYTENGELKIIRNVARAFMGRIDLSKLNLPSSGYARESIAISTDEVFAAIEKFTLQRYAIAKDCSKRKPRLDAFRTTEKDNKLVLTVSGLCKEVIADEQELALCEVLKRLSWDCEAVKREQLNFEFYYDAESQRIYCKLDGKFSSDYLLFHGRLKDMDNVPEFEARLNEYGAAYLTELKEWIEED